MTENVLMKTFQNLIHKWKSGPNMMVFGTGEDFDLKFMAKHGFALNILACLIGMIYLNFVMPLILSPDQYGPPLQFADNAGPNATVLCP